MGLIQDQITLATLAAVTATGNSAVFDLSGYKSGALYFNITTASGTTPSLTPALQATIDGTNFTAVPTSVLAAVTAITAVGLSVVSFIVPLGLAKCRFAYTVSGTTPSFSGTITGILNKT
jgi:hypothetical protein